MPAWPARRPRGRSVRRRRRHFIGADLGEHGVGHFELALGSRGRWRRSRGSSARHEGLSRRRSKDATRPCGRFLMKPTVSLTSTRHAFGVEDVRTVVSRVAKIVGDQHLAAGQGAHQRRICRHWCSPPGPRWRGLAVPGGGRVLRSASIATISSCSSAMRSRILRRSSSVRLASPAAAATAPLSPPAAEPAASQAGVAPCSRGGRSPPGPWPRASVRCGGRSEDDHVRSITSQAHFHLQVGAPGEGDSFSDPPASSLISRPSSLAT